MMCVGLGKRPPVPQAGIVCFHAAIDKTKGQLEQAGSSSRAHAGRRAIPEHRQNLLLQIVIGICSHHGFPKNRRASG
jgi:hypothetical protein